MSTSTSWVLDNGCGSHICTSVQGLKRSRTLDKGEVDLRVGNGARVTAVAIGTYEISLPSGLVLSLNNCYYVPSLTRNIISVSVLDNEGYSFIISNKRCSIYLDYVLYCIAESYDGLYVLNLETRNDKVQVLNVDTKRAKPNELNPTYLWHCRLGHISEKRIAKLHSDGLLESVDYESYDTCESCLMGKMTKMPFKGKGQRASDLLGLIHTDVCGPLSISARGGFQYFITFTDDFSRYGYVYLMKHKLEAFEMFRTFQNEVQNQHGKTIKAIRSYCDGEYMSQVWDDHLR